MTTLNPATAIVPPRRFRITRELIFGFLFLLVGLKIISDGLAIPSDIITTITFSGQTDPITLALSTSLFALMAGSFVVFSGGMSMFAPARLRGLATVLMTISLFVMLLTMLIIGAGGKTTEGSTLIRSSFQLATPVAIGALAGIWCERSGIVNIAIEGMMLVAACFGYWVLYFLRLSVPADQYGTALAVGVFIAILGGGLMALLHAWLSITFRVDQIISGTVINILAVGLTAFIRRQYLSSSEGGLERLPSFSIPVLKDIPFIGTIFTDGQPIFYTMLLLVIGTHLVLFYSRWGLRTRAVGEKPSAADTLGINVNRMRWANVFIAGLLAGLAGAWFSIEATGSFSEGMTRGAGFIALAAMIFGNWTPFGAFGAALLFGFSDSLQLRFQILEIPVPYQFLQMVPYIITLIVLAGLVGKAYPPKAAGVPYTKE